MIELIDYTKLNIGMVIGRAIIYDVKKYDNKVQFIKDKNMHLADSSLFDSYIYGFKIKNAQQLKRRITFDGRLGFFEVDLNKITDLPILQGIISLFTHYIFVSHSLWLCKFYQDLKKAKILKKGIYRNSILVCDRKR